MSDPTDATGASGAQMRQIWIPSNRIMQLDPEKFSPPQKYLLSAAVKALYEALPRTYKTIFDSFGTGKTAPPPLKSDPPQLAALGTGSVDAIAQQKGSGTTNYLEVVSRLKASFQNLKLADASIAPLANKTASVSQAAQQAINDMIDAIHESAKKLPPTTTDDWVQTYLADAADQATATLNQAKAQYELLGKGVDDATGKIPPEVEARLKALEGKSGAGDPPPVDPNQRGLGGLNNGQVYQPPNLGLGSWNPGGTGQTPGSVTPTPDPTLPPKTDGTTPPDTSKDDPSRDIPDIGQQPDNTLPTPQQPQYPNMATPATMGGMGGGMDPMSMMLPSLMSAMQPNMNDRLQADPNRYDREDPYDRYPQNAVPVQASPAAVTPQAPAATPPATTTTPPATTDKPAGPAQPAAPATTVAPGEDGGVDYPFPDGITQRVSVVVAKALDKAFGNKSGTDAPGAYADTTAKLDVKQPDQRVDPEALMTGDVGIWENPDLVAIVRAMGSGAEARLDLIVKGELRRYPDQISETTGDLGQLVGWAHPRGIEMTGTSAKHTDGAAPGTGDPATSLPVVAAPAS